MDAGNLLLRLLLQERVHYSVCLQRSASNEKILRQFETDRMKRMIFMKAINGTSGIINPERSIVHKESPALI